jgi:hypothetical protein
MNQTETHPANDLVAHLCSLAALACAVTLLALAFNVVRL